MTRIINVMYAKILYSSIATKQKTTEEFRELAIHPVKVTDVINQTRKIQKEWQRCVLVFLIAKYAKIRMFVMNAEQPGYCNPKKQVVINPVLIV